MSEPDPQPKPGLKPLRALLPYLRPYRGLALGWLLFLAISTAATLTLPDGVTCDEVQAALEAISGEIMVDFTIQPGC